MYYNEKIAPIVEAELTPGANNAKRLGVIKRVTRQLWESETGAVVERVLARQAELRREKKEALANPPKLLSAEEISEYIFFCFEVGD